MPSLRKLPECQHCQFNGRWSKTDRRSSTYIVCAVHPGGAPEDYCIDFRPICNTQSRLKLTMEEYMFYGSDYIAIAPTRLTQSDRELILNTHPLYTGKCPQCNYQFPKDHHFNGECPVCNWRNSDKI